MPAPARPHTHRRRHSPTHPHTHARTTTTAQPPTREAAILDDDKVASSYVKKYISATAHNTHSEHGFRRVVGARLHVDGASDVRSESRGKRKRATARIAEPKASLLPTSAATKAGVSAPRQALRTAANVPTTRPLPATTPTTTPSLHAPVVPAEHVAVVVASSNDRRHADHGKTSISVAAPHGHDDSATRTVVADAQASAAASESDSLIVPARRARPVVGPSFKAKHKPRPPGVSRWGGELVPGRREPPAPTDPTPGLDADAEEEKERKKEEARAYIRRKNTARIEAKRREREEKLRAEAEMEARLAALVEKRKRQRKAVSAPSQADDPHEPRAGRAAPERTVSSASLLASGGESDDNNDEDDYDSPAVRASKIAMIEAESHRIALRVNQLKALGVRGA